MKKEKKPYVLVKLTWDCYDQKQCEEEFPPEEFYSNRGLINALTYINLPQNFKGETEEPRFGDYVPYNEDIPIWNFLYKYGLTTEDSMGMDPDGLEDIEIFLVKGNIYKKIDEKVFEPVTKRWKNMSYNEIIDEVNESFNMKD